MAARHLLVLALAAAGAQGTTPITKVLDLISNLQAKVVGEGEQAQKAYAEFAEWCEDRSKQLQFEIKTGKQEVESLSAAIESATASISTLGVKIEELGSNIASSEAELKSAEGVRAKEAEDFSAEKAELAETIDTLERAISIISREMGKGAASMLQGKTVSQLAQAFEALVEASVLNSADAKRLTSLVQSSQSGEDADDDTSAPAAAVYTSQSGGIVETLEGLLDKAREQLSAAEKKETNGLHSFAMMKQSLEDEMKFNTADMTDAKASLSETSAKKATEVGDLEVTEKDLAGDQQTLADLHADCLARSEDFEAATKSRTEELTALAEAKKVIVEATGGAEKISYGAASLLQTASDEGSGSFAALRFVRDLARRQKSPALAQLASRMDAVMGSGDPFAKVKGLISDLITRLEEEAASDATEKAYCDKELKKSTEKSDAKTAEIEKQTAKINQMEAQSAVLKEEVAGLQKALAEIAATQAEMTKLRQEQKAEFTTTKADLEQGLEGVKTALKILREYYATEGKAHTAGEGAGGGIIGLLEVVEADFTKGLANTIATEEGAAAAYEKETKENEIETTAKNQDVKYKTKEAADLDKSVAETTSDRASVQAELDAVSEYLEKLKKRCVAKAETYEARVGRREAEIAGLKEALEVLEGETALLQRGASRKKGLRSYVISADGAM